MARGTVKWFNAQKGYGFIQPDDGSKDVFVHISAVERAWLTSINENQKLSYELERGQQGKTSAVNLHTEYGPMARACPGTGRHCGRRSRKWLASSFALGQTDRVWLGMGDDIG